jgi:hypothetical protein
VVGGRGIGEADLAVVEWRWVTAAGGGVGSVGGAGRRKGEGGASL